MIDLLLVVAFIALPLATFFVTRSLTWTAVGLAFGLGIAGNAVQSLTTLGVNWNVRGLQVLVLVVMAIVLVIGAVYHRSRASMRSQLLVVGLPALAIAAFLIAMRVMAPGSPGPLSAVGYLINHPQAEDNAKWLHLTSQLADGRLVDFSGYAGGPLLLVMAMMAALIAVLSQILLGGVNEVAVAVNAVVGTQFLLIALIPFVFAPFVEKKISLRGDPYRRVPWPTVLIGMFVVFVASSVVTSFGHLSLQYVLLVVVLWSAVFAVRIPGRARLLMTLAVATTAAVWLPFNILGLLVLIACLVWVLRRRDWLGLGAWVVTVAAVWDAIISSTLFLLGIDLTVGSSPEPAGIAGEGSSSTVQTAVLEQVETARSLFTAPGGVEQIAPLVGGLALASTLFAVWLIARAGGRRWTALAPFLPIVVMGGYLLVIQVADAISTGGAPHYGGHKLAFAFTIMALASTLPIAIAGLDRGTRGMTPVGWFAIGGVVMLLMVDTMLPRAISALSPVLWPAVNSEAPPYWAAAEVKPQAEQPISSLPIACVFAPPESDIPTALPLGQQAYNCTRMLLGMNGLESEATVLVKWLQTDWFSNEPHWDDFYGVLQERTGPLKGRTVVLMNDKGDVAGLTTIGSLLQQYPVATR